MSSLQILKNHFGMVAPDIEIDDGKGTILVSSEEGETEGPSVCTPLSVLAKTPSDIMCSNFALSDNLPRRLAEFGVADGCRLKCDDFLQNYQLILDLVHRYNILS